jgi:hypothetical protein
MLRVELGQLKPLSLMNIVIGLVVMGFGSAAVYWLDGARLAAFGLVPAAFVITLTEQAGVTIKKTPVLFVLCAIVALLLFGGAAWYVLSHPKA